MGNYMGNYSNAKTPEETQYQETRRKLIKQGKDIVDHLCDRAEEIEKYVKECAKEMTEKEAMEEQLYSKVLNEQKAPKAHEGPIRKAMTMKEYTEKTLEGYRKTAEEMLKALEEGKVSWVCPGDTWLKSRIKYEEYNSMTLEERIEKHKRNFARNTVNHDEYTTCSDTYIALAEQNMVKLIATLHILKGYRMELISIREQWKPIAAELK